MQLCRTPVPNKGEAFGRKVEGPVFPSVLPQGPEQPDFLQTSLEALSPDDQWKNPPNRIGCVKFQILCKFTARIRAQLLLRV